jgi:transcription elongation factor GreA
MGTIPMTPAGLKKLQEKLNHLKKVERPKNIKEIELARSHGDLSENAEFHAAKERQGIIAAQIVELERQIAEANVIDPSSIAGEVKVVFGATVRLLDTDSAEEKVYQIVGAVEADIASARISVESPIARSLIGQEVGAVVTVTTPKGAREFEILEITYS